MRSVVLGLVVTGLMSCGPSSAELNNAKAASYKGSSKEIWDIVEQTTAETYKIGESACAGESIADCTLITVPQWYNPEGGRQSAGAGDFVQLVDRSVQLTMVVQLSEPNDGRLMVTVTPKTFQHVSGSPQPRELQPGDPNLPGWVEGRVDSLHYEIHKRLQNYAVQ